MEEGKKKLKPFKRNNHLAQRTSSEEKNVSIMKSGVLMLMCCSRLSSLPHGDDVPWYCLDMSASCYTVLSVWPAHSHWSGLQNSRSEKNQNIQQSYRPVPHAESVWAAVENNSTYKKKPTEVFLFFLLLLSLLWTEI